MGSHTKWIKYKGVFKLFCLLTSLYIAYTLSYVALSKFNASTFLKNSTARSFLANPSVQEPADEIEVLTIPAKIRVESHLRWCGLGHSCPEDHFPIHIYTGQDHKDEPRLCLDGKYVLSKSINSGGRGINVAVIDSLTRSLVQVSHFDTYEKESSGLETLLLTLRPGDILVLLTFDEPTRKLSRVTRLLLHELGSALIQNLFYRGSWYMVTQKGITGFSPFEELHYGEGGGWSQVHDARFCVPFHIQGQPIHPDPLPRVNPSRVLFCKEYPSFPNFCDADEVNSPLIAAPALKQSTGFTRLFTTPILVLAGQTISFLPLTLESVLRQPGVNPSLVVVFYQSEARIVNRLVNLFGFMSEELSSSPSNNTCEIIAEMFETAYLLFPDSKHLMLVSEDVILSPDFLHFFSQLLPLLDSDTKLQAVSAWNENGFKTTSSDPSLAYRTDSFSAVASMIRKGFFQRSWCTNWTSGDTYLLKLAVPPTAILVPDVSRADVMRSSHRPSYLRFDDRFSSTAASSEIADIHLLHHDEYPQHLHRLIQQSSQVHLTSHQVSTCQPLDSLLPHNHSNCTVFYPQQSPSDLSSLSELCRCWGLFYISPDLPPRPLFHHTVLRWVLSARP